MSSASGEGAFSPFLHYREGGMRSHDLCALTGVAIVSLRVTVLYPSPRAARPLRQAQGPEPCCSCLLGCLT